MDASDIFNRGDSIPRTIVLTYEDTNLPIDLDDLDEIEFEVIHSVTNRVLGIYTLTDNEILIVNAEAGETWFAIGQTLSLIAKRGNYLINTKSEETDTDYENNIHVRTGRGFCFKLN